MGQVGLGPITGSDAYLYFNTGIEGTPVWQEVTEVTDVSFNASLNTTEMKRRSHRYVKNLSTLYQPFTAEFTLVHGLDDTTFDLLIAAWTSRSVDEWLFFDAPKDNAAGEGYRCPMVITQFTFNQPLEDVSTHQVSLTSAYLYETVATEVEPSWATGSQA